MQSLQLLCEGHSQRLNHASFIATMWVKNNAMWNGVIKVFSEKSIPQPFSITTIFSEICHHFIVGNAPKEMWLNSYVC